MSTERREPPPAEGIPESHGEPLGRGVGKDFPIETEISSGDLSRAERVARDLLREHPELVTAPELAELTARSETTAFGTLHLDDQSDIASNGARYDASHIQDRARIRAVGGDFVAANVPPVEGYEAYCRELLGLGAVEWIAPGASRYRRNLAGHCWTSRLIRKRLIRAAKSEDLRVIHPLMGSVGVWLLARMLSRATRRRVTVMAPPPSVTRFVNDKTEFAGIVVGLFGNEACPRSHVATSLAVVCRNVRELASGYERVVIKIPDGAGGAGNVVLECGPLRRKDLTEIRAQLAPILRRIGWRSGERLQVSAWQNDVLSAPSVQTWIPPSGAGPVRVDGVFEQLLEGPSYEFTGTMPALLPASARHRIVARAVLLAMVFQRLGYVGRCSFDLVLAGRDVESSEAVLIECNGRWGGTSLPMTLVSRLLPGRAVDYVVRSLIVPGLRDVPFHHLLERFEEDLFDVETGRGWLVLFNPARLRAQSGVSFIALGESLEEARYRAEDLLSHRLRDMTRFSRPRMRVSLP